jgi:hypothetical protein
MVYLRMRVLWFGIVCSRRESITTVLAACGSVKIFMRAITQAVPRRQSLQEAKGLWQDLRPMASPTMWQACKMLGVTRRMESRATSLC